MKTIKIIILSCMVLLLAGCYGFRPINQGNISDSNYGPYPDNYEILVKDYFTTMLKDPYSAVYRFNKPVKGYLRKAPIAGGDPSVYGYVVMAFVNAKNSYGGYTGQKKYNLFIKNSLVQEIYPNTWFPEFWYQH